MTARSLTRAGFFAALTGALVLAAAPEALAARNTNAEQYVQTSAVDALAALGNRGVSSASRDQTFHTLMAQFADLPRVATFVLGRYGSALRADPQLRTDWNRAFEDYSIATYQARLDSFSGGNIRVTGSTEVSAGRDVIVISRITPRAGAPVTVQWRVLRSGNVWKVTDVSILNSGGEIWLAQQQQQDFLAALDRNHGNVRALIGEVQGLTQRLRRETMARN